MEPCNCVAGSRVELCNCGARSPKQCSCGDRSPVKPCNCVARSPMEPCNCGARSPEQCNWKWGPYGAMRMWGYIPGGAMQLCG